MVNLTPNEVLADVRTALQTRAVYKALSANSTEPGSPKVFLADAAKDLAAVGAGKFWVVIEVDKTALANLSDKAFGVIVAPGRTAEASAS
ncbi:MAG: hypothetical protein IPH13_20035 [Planctomycetes bacterium]|nr:hypothetical protein [Planctomycetota bacterium]